MNKIILSLILFSFLSYANEFNNPPIEINIGNAGDWGINIESLGGSRKSIEFQVKIPEKIQGTVNGLTPKIISLVDPIRSTWSMYEVTALPMMAGYKINREVLSDSYLEVLLESTGSLENKNIILKINLKDFIINK